MLINKNNLFPIFLILAAITTAAILSFPQIRAAITFNKSAATGSVNSLNQGLVGHWTFDVDAGTTEPDSSGNGNTGTAIGGPTATDGKLGRGLNFDGSDDYVTIDGVTNDIQNSTQGAIAFWINFDATGFNQAPFSISRNSDGVRTDLFFELFNGNWIVRVNIDGTEQWTISVSGPSAGQWYHIAVTHDGVEPKIFIDGVDVTSFSGTTDKTKWFKAILTDATSDADSSSIGVFKNNSDTLVEPFDGKIDDVRIYNRALSAAEVARLANQAGKVTRKQAPTNGLIAHWTMDDISGTSVPDKTGNGHTGTLTNGPIVVKGKLKNGVFFDGDDQYADFGSFTEIDAFSVSLWGKRRAGADALVTYDVVFGYNADYAGVAIKTSTFAFSVFNEGGSEIAAWQAGETTWQPDDEWHHIVYMQDGSGAGSNVNVYFDGEELGSKSVNAAAFNTFRLGQLATVVAGRAFGGIFDDVRIYNRELTSSEVLGIMGDRPATINKTPQGANNALSFGNSLVGHYTFDGPDIDWSTGTLINVAGATGNGAMQSGFVTSTSPILGKVGQALNLPANGSNQAIDVSSASGIAHDVAKGSTVSAWVKVPVTHDQNYPGIISREFGTVIYVGGNANSGHVRVDPKNSPTGGIGHAGTTDVRDNEWHHVTVTTSTEAVDETKIYVDGVLEKTAASVPTTNTTAFCIGAGNAASPACNGEFFRGGLDDLRIYNRVLTASEVLTLYNATK